MYVRCMMDIVKYFHAEKIGDLGFSKVTNSMYIATQ